MGLSQQDAPTTCGVLVLQIAPELMASTLQLIVIHDMWVVPRLMLPSLPQTLELSNALVCSDEPLSEPLDFKKEVWQ